MEEVVPLAIEEDMADILEEQSPTLVMEGVLREPIPEIKCRSSQS